jgi:thiol-disulfide isomerase/thioredoxin
MTGRSGTCGSVTRPSLRLLIAATLSLTVVGAGCAPAAAPPVSVPDDLWRTAELRDVRSGETLVVNELTRAGLLVVIEPMAIWCTSCRIQQNEARTALAELARDDIVYISLDVDPNETEPDLARYADERDYPWHFVVASRDVARSIAQDFGDQVLSPPSTPKIVIARDGQAEVSFGIKRADQLQAEFAALLP